MSKTKSIQLSALVINLKTSDSARYQTMTVPIRKKKRKKKKKVFSHTRCQARCISRGKANRQPKNKCAWRSAVSFPVRWLEIAGGKNTPERALPEYLSEVLRNSKAYLPSLPNQLRLVEMVLLDPTQKRDNSPVLYPRRWPVISNAWYKYDPEETCFAMEDELDGWFLILFFSVDMQI